MNIQNKKNSSKLHERGIQWCDFTHNVIGGCQHGCRWTMPDGKIAICYAEEIAQKFTAGYPEGFAHHYWRPAELKAPAKLKKPAKIFIDSMSDLFGRWVPEDQIWQVLDMCSSADWHTFQVLTKNAPRLMRFDIPQNVWVGCSSPPDQMLGQHLTRLQQEKMLRRTLETLSQKANITWISFEPLSWDVAPIVAEYPEALNWAVIGAATNGPKVYAIDPGIVQNLLDVLDAQRVPIFFKGNLEKNAAATPWREFFPGYVPSQWNEATAPA